MAYKADSLANWLIFHPSVEIISRDRGGEFAKGAAQGAPQAIQIADRWHLLKKSCETLQRIIDRHQQQVRESVKSLSGERNCRLQKKEKAFYEKHRQQRCLLQCVFVISPAMIPLSTTVNLRFDLAVGQFL